MTTCALIGGARFDGEPPRDSFLRKTGSEAVTCPSEGLLPTCEGIQETMLLLLFPPLLTLLIMLPPIRRQRASLHFGVHTPYRANPSPHPHPTPGSQNWVKRNRESWRVTGSTQHRLQDRNWIDWEGCDSGRPKGVWVL